jgi:hypothetical protein
MSPELALALLTLAFCSFATYTRHTPTPTPESGTSIFFKDPNRKNDPGGCPSLLRQGSFSFCFCFCAVRYEARSPHGKHRHRHRHRHRLRYNAQCCGVHLVLSKASSGSARPEVTLALLVTSQGRLALRHNKEYVNTSS